MHAQSFRVWHMESYLLIYFSPISLCYDQNFSKPADFFEICIDQFLQQTKKNKWNKMKAVAHFMLEIHSITLSVTVVKWILRIKYSFIVVNKGTYLGIKKTDPDKTKRNWKDHGFSSLLAFLTLGWAATFWELQPPGQRMYAQRYGTFCIVLTIEIYSQRIRQFTILITALNLCPLSWKAKTIYLIISN